MEKRTIYDSSFNIGRSEIGCQAGKTVSWYAPILDLDQGGILITRLNESIPSAFRL